MPKLIQDRPLNAFEVKTYEEYRDHIGKLYAPQSSYNALLVVGNNGIGKSETCKELYGRKNIAVTSGKPSAWKFYQWVYANRDKRILELDDVSKKSYQDSDFNSMLKNLMETRPIKTIRYPTDAAKQAGIPSEFKTSAKVIILANTWNSSSSEDYAAIDWRCVSMLFNPTPDALHWQVNTFFYDQEVFDFIGQNLTMVTKPNMRMYGTISSIKRAGDKTWKLKALEIMAGSDQMVKVFKILTDPDYKTSADRIKAFEKSGLGKKSLYYELVAQFKWLKEMPKGNPPPLKFTEPQLEEEEESEDEELDLGDEGGN